MHEGRDVPKHPRGGLKADIKGGEGGRQPPHEKVFGFKSPSGDLKPNTGGLKADFVGVGSLPRKQNKNRKQHMYRTVSSQILKETHNIACRHKHAAVTP